MISARITVRKDRKKLAAVLRAYLNDKLSFRELCEVTATLHESRDPTVAFVIERTGDELEGVIEDPDQLEKSDWDFLQRMLLLLDSNHHVVREYRWHWCYTQIVALAALFWVVWLLVGLGVQWIVVATIPATLISLWLFRVRSRKIARPWQEQLEPFGTIEQLRQTYEAVPAFCKQRFPRQKNRGRISQALDGLGLAFVFGWIFAMLVMSPPISLIVQLLPIYEERVDVVVQ